MKNFIQDIEIVSVNYNTPDLIERLELSIRKYIGEDNKFSIIDGSTINYYSSVLHLNRGKTKVTHFNYNIHHGPGMDYAIRNSDREFILILDSDVTIINEGLLEKMMSLFKKDTYCVGRLIFVDRNGHNDKEGEIAYIHPSCIMIRRSQYLKYHGFKLHGAPCIDAMKDIHDSKKTHTLVDFEDIDNYIKVDCRGTVSRFGYGIKLLRKKLKKSYPLINIPLRTSGRPNYFRNCIESIFNQTYKNVRLLVSVDDDETYQYVKDYGIKDIIHVPKLIIENKTYFDPDIGRTRRHAPYNLHLNRLYQEITEGYVVGLDDDDMFAVNDALEEITSHIGHDNQLLFWKVEFPNGQIIPPDSVWGQPPACCKFSGLGYAWHIRYKNHTQWDEWTLGDYRSASKLYKIIKDKIFINRVLSKVQRKVANGLGRRDDL